MRLLAKTAVLFLIIFFVSFRPAYSQTIAGDLDKDGDVDIFDYNILIENFGVTSCGNVADIDGNCKVDIFDYNLLVGNFGLILTPTPTPAQPDAAMYRVNPQHSGVYESKAVSNLNQLKWKIRPGDWGASSAPTVHKGVVYFGGWDDYLYAVDAQTGVIKWNFKTQDFINHEPALEGNIIYFGDYAGYFYAVDINTHQEKWRFLTKSQKSGGSVSFARHVKSAPTLVDGKVYFSDNTGRLYALNTTTGEEIWEVESPLIFRMTSAVVVNNIAYFGSDAGYLFAVDVDTGQELWNFKTTYGGSIWATPAFLQNKIYFPSNDGFLYAVDTQTGKGLWAYKYKPEHIQAVFPQPVAALNGEIYVSGTNDNFFEVIDAETGGLKRSFLAESWVESPPSIAENVVYFGTNDLDGDHHGYLYAVDTQTMQERWRFKTQKLGIKDSPVIYNGTVYFKDVDGNIYAME